jgi:hypothetical protein
MFALVQPRRLAVWLIVLGGALAPSTAIAQTGPQPGDARVSAGSPDSPFSRNKQNEPAVAIDPWHPNIVAAGANDNIDMEACNAGPDDDCPFTPDVGVSGIYFSTNGGADWTQPTYQGWTARACTGTAGTAEDECHPNLGPIGTLPNYYENALISDGDPAVAWGPVYDRSTNTFSRSASRLYYANLTANFGGSGTFKGAEAIAVSRTDDVAGAIAGDNGAWMDPVIASKQNGGKFSDKEQIWADNAATSRFYGNVYVCYAAFRGNGNGTINQPLNVIVSRDGGDTWSDQQLTPAAISTTGQNGFGRSGCTVRTDSAGNAYIFDFQFGFADVAAQGWIEMFKSTDGGRRWSKPQRIFPAFDSCDYIEPSIGRCVMDGVGGARSDLSPAPSVDIANNAPTGTGATDRMVMSWVDGEQLNAEKVMYSTSGPGGTSWTPPADVGEPGDRGYYAAPAISPNGQEVWVVYNAWTTPFRESAVGAGNDRQLLGVVRHADWGGAFTTIHRGASGDARGSSQNDLAAEFLGDYVYASARDDFAVGVWNDVRNAQDCPAIDTYRQALHDEAVATGQQTAEPEEPRGLEEREGDKPKDEEAGPERPEPQQDCPARFGNSDIFGGRYTTP